jgi:hypothetical protein
MLLDKLWVRIRGSLLTLKEDFSLGDEVRDKAQRLLEKLDLQEASRETANGAEKPSEGDREEHVQVTRTQTLEEIKQEWEELLRSKESGKDRTSGSSQQPPNPRRLG